MAADSLLSSPRSPELNTGHQSWQQAPFTLSSLIGPGLVWFAGVLGIKPVPFAHKADTLTAGPPSQPRGGRCDGVCGTWQGGGLRSSRCKRTTTANGLQKLPIPAVRPAQLLINIAWAPACKEPFPPRKIKFIGQQ